MFEDLALDLIPEDEHSRGEIVWWMALRDQVRQALETVHNASAAMAIGAEREACAKEADRYAHTPIEVRAITAEQIAIAIRARGGKRE